jgi:hypothetical protein
MATKKPLLVPVILTGGIMHDTDYTRGAESREEAERINAELRAQGLDDYGHDRALKYGATYVMEAVEPFEARLRVVSADFKCSYVNLVDEAGNGYPMFTTDYVALMSTATVTEGLIESRTYETCKKGARAYGIRPVKK